MSWLWRLETICANSFEMQLNRCLDTTQRDVKRLAGCYATWQIHD